MEANIQNPYLMVEISKFNTVWLILPSDKVITSVQPQQKFYTEYFASGYIARKRKYLDEQDSNTKEQQSSMKYTLPDPGIITFALKPPLLQFNRHPFVRTLHIQNRSPLFTYPFKLYIRNNEHFSAHPSSGILKPNQHLPIQITFHPQHSRWRKEAEILGSIQVRIGEESWPGERCQSYFDSSAIVSLNYKD